MEQTITSDYSQPTASAAQRAWMGLGYGMFLHFGPNTFAGVGWGNGTFPAEKFAPSDLDCDQWAGVIAESGMTYAVLTTKHHDGFCLWPGKYTEYSVKNGGLKKDIVALFVEACRATCRLMCERPSDSISCGKTSYGSPSSIPYLKTTRASAFSCPWNIAIA